MDQTSSPERAGAVHDPTDAVGSREWFASLYHGHADSVYAFIRYWIRDASQAEDLTSAVFERAWKRADTYQSAKGSVQVWLFGIARNAVRDAYRRNNRVSIRPFGEGGQAASDQEGLEDALIRHQTYESLRQALERLDPRARTIVALRYAAGLRNVEIAGIMRMSEKHVSVVLSRACRKLKTWLEEVLADDA